jgi:CBS domain-containing protein
VKTSEHCHPHLNDPIETDLLKSRSFETPLVACSIQMDRKGVSQLPVTRNNQVIGMLSREDVITFLHTLQELGT